MRDILAKNETALLIGKLSRAYGKPFGTKAEELIDLWHDKLRFNPASVVTDIVNRWIETETRYPTIAAILARVRANKPRTDAERNPRLDTCSSCSGAFRWAGYEIGTSHDNRHHTTGLVLPRLRCDCRQDGTGWNTTRARQWTQKPTEVTEDGEIVGLDK